MRIVQIALMSLLLGNAVPSPGFAQLLFPFQGKGWNYDDHLDRAVPVAIVSRVGDFFALADARIVDDGHGEPFALGTATLDLRDPAHAKIGFRMTNSTGAPILYQDVMIDGFALCAVPRHEGLFTTPGFGGRTSDGFHDPRQFQPSEEITVQIPIPPNCGKGVTPSIIIVSVGAPGPGQWSSSPSLRATTRSPIEQGEQLAFRVLERLRAEASTSAAGRPSPQ